MGALVFQGLPVAVWQLRMSLAEFGMRILQKEKTAFLTSSLLWTFQVAFGMKVHDRGGHTCTSTADEALLDLEIPNPETTKDGSLAAAGRG